MRALRDFNTPKIVTDDVPIFMGLIGDLFPALNVPRKRDMDFEAMVKKSVVVSTSTLFIMLLKILEIDDSLAIYKLRVHIYAVTSNITSFQDACVAWQPWHNE